MAIELALRDGAESEPIKFLESLAAAFASASEAAPRPSGRRGAPVGDLTERQVEIFRLVGLGRSDQQIADELFISRKTASVHVSHVKAKLGLASRLEVALRARETGRVGTAEG